MKKTYVLIAIILLLTTASNVLSGTRPRYGIKAGISLADQTWEYRNLLGKVDRDQRKGLACGVFADLSFTPLVQFRPEVLYVQKGSQIKVLRTSYTGIPTGASTFKDRIDYLSLVAAFKLQLSHGPLGFYLLGGPRLDVKLSATSDFPDPTMQLILDAYKLTVPGLTLGIGFQGATGLFGPMMLEARYDYNPGEAARFVSTENVLEINNKSFSILVGLLF